MATLGRTLWGNNPAAWELAQQLQAQGMGGDASLAMVDRMLADQTTAHLAIRSAANPGPGQSFDVTVDRSTIYSQIDEADANGNTRRVQEIRLNNLVRMQSRGERR